MDPLTVLSLVSNVVQLVQATTDAATKCHQIYKKGASIEDLQMAYTSDQLHQCYTTLDNSLQSNQSNQPLPCGVDLKSLSSECSQSAKVLHEELKALQKGAGEGRRKAFAKFILRNRKGKDIEVLQSRLKEYQTTLDTRVSVDIWQTVTDLSSRQQTRDLELDQKLSKLAADLASCHGSAADNLRHAIERAVEANKHEHEITRSDIRSHFDSTVYSQAEREEKAKQHDQFLESLRYDDINVRGNDISQSHPETFRWVFDEKGKHSWDSLSDWLQNGKNVYWINGKAGSGKSTFMKFLINDERTSQALDIWSGDKGCMILKFYFWLSGSKFQRSMKGCICSLLRQIASNNEKVVGDIILTHNAVTRKRSIGDWSTEELRELLEFAIKSVTRTGKICIFLDGIDEFDQDVDVQQLLDLIEQLVEFPSIKVCVSSRPEVHIEICLSQYDKLRLQDLTAKDMKLCIRDTLNRVYKRYPSMNITTEDIQKFTRLMTEKADGVFLWVYFAMNGLLKGMKNEDDFEVLLIRLEKLSSGMEQLYQQMWLRLNGDEELYRKEASLYISYHEYFPLSLFEMMVALDIDVQTSYLHDMRSPNSTEMAHRCEKLRTRILTRCAGLLEVATVNEEAEDSDFLSTASGSDVSASATSGSGSKEEASLNVELPQLTEDEAGYETSSAVDISPSLGSVASGTSSNAQDIAHTNLRQYYHLKIKYLHRTARDFLFDTEVGRAIAGEPTQTRDDRLSNVMRARMAKLLEGFQYFQGNSVTEIVGEIGRYDTESEIDLLKSLRQVCEALNVPGSPRHDVTRSDFWTLYDTLPCDFVGNAAKFGCIKYVQFYVDHASDPVSPYYRGYLFQSAVTDLDRSWISAPLRKAQLAWWLAENGADLSTKHQVGWRRVGIPFESLLLVVIWHSTFTGELATQMTQLIERLLSSAVNPMDKSIVEMRVPEELYKSLDIARVEVEIGANCFCRLAMYHLARHGAVIGSIKPLPSRSNIPLRVLYFNKSDTARCPTFEDSIYLGQAYERVLFPEDYTDAPAQSLQNLTSRIEEALPRCEEGDWDKWHFERGLYIDEHKDALVLDPSEDVNESNWTEKGYFRTASTVTKEESASTASESTSQEMT